MTEHRLPEQLDIRRIAEAHRALVEALSSTDGTVRLDARAVARIDTAGVQLLAAALGDTSGGRAALADPPPCVVEAFEALDLAHLLNP